MPPSVGSRAQIEAYWIIYKTGKPIGDPEKFANES
jgi:hypothetical protein